MLILRGRAAAPVVSQPWYPAEHTYTGEPGTRKVLPHFATMPDLLRVYDTAVRNSGWARWQKTLWRKARNLGIGRWGYPVRVVERLGPIDYPPEGITVDHFTTTPGYGANSVGGFGLAPRFMPETSEYDPDTWAQGKGFALINDVEVNKAFAGRVVGRLAGVICHEVGHTLGFGHGGDGIMESAVDPPFYPNAEELAAVAAYWGTA